MLQGKVALVTGAARRLGRAIAEGLAADGADVVAHYRTSAAEADRLVDTLRAAGGSAWALQADLGEVTEASGLVERAREAAGRPIDILVNSAGIYEPSRLLEFGADELVRNVQINAFAPLLLARALAAQGRPGQIVNLLDARMGDYDREHAAYHLSKRMLHALTRMLSVELAPGIRVNAVAPGLVLPPEGRDEAYLQRLAGSTLLERHGCADDVVRAVRYLLCSEFVTGQILYADGGRSLRGSMYGA